MLCEVLLITGLLFSHKNEILIHTTTLTENWTHLTKWKESTKEQTYDLFLCFTQNR